MTRVPLFDFSVEHEALRSQLTDAFTRVLGHGAFVLGAEVQAFERQAAAYLGSRHAVGLSSGSDALYLGLRALGVSSGDEVITSPFTFVATAEAILRCGGTPVFADIEPESLGLCPVSTASLRTSRTRAVLAVHLYGHPGTALALEGYCATEGVPLVEDACQAFGATIDHRPAGTLGTLGVYSFFPTKPLGGFGDGGLLVTDDEAVACRVRALRSHGVGPDGHYESLAGNYRLDALQAALLAVKLGHVRRTRDERERLAERYDNAFADLPYVQAPRALPEFVESAWSLYTVRVPRHREALLAHLHAQGVEARSYYSRLLPEQPLFANQARSGPLIHARAAAAEVLSLPLYAGLSPDAQSHVIEAVRSYRPNA